MQGTAAISARMRSRRSVFSAHRLTRAALAAGLFWTTLAASAPLFGQATRPAANTPRPAVGAKSARVASNTATATKPTGHEQKVMAVVNGEQIGRQELATECLRRYGKDVLQTLV